MKYITILGSTGSIGRNTLEVIRNFPNKFKVRSLSANSNITLLYKQIREFKPKFVCLQDEHRAAQLKSKLKNKAVKVLVGDAGLENLARDKSACDIVLAISGSSALKPLMAAIEANKTIALANKEALVMAGPIIMNKASQKRVKIIPIDSEQSAIWQCLDGEDRDKVKNIYLTASGGPLRKSSLARVGPKDVLRHPRWKMGKKITVDSATLMNKGLEFLESIYLFNLKPKMIKILIHPQAIIHSMVEFIDGVILAQLSVTDMRIPIQYALSYPERLRSALKGLNFFKLKRLDFEKPDLKKFPCLKLAYQAARMGGTMPAVLLVAVAITASD